MKTNRKEIMKKGRYRIVIHNLRDGKTKSFTIFENGKLGLGELFGKVKRYIDKL